MHIFPVFIALAVERFADLDAQWRQPAALVANGDWLKSRLLTRGGLWDGYPGALLMIFLPAFAISLVDDALSGLFFGLLEWGFAAAVLLYCLGPVNHGALTRELDEALISGDETSARRHTRDLLGAEPPANEANWPRTVAHSLLAESAERLFSVVFWFVLVGPVGAVVYRVSALLRQGRSVENPPEGQGKGFHHAVHHLHQLLAWLPVRLLAASFALAGRFNETLVAWQSHDYRCADVGDKSGKGLLVCTGCAAAGIPLKDQATAGEDEGEIDSVDGSAMLDALGLLERTQVIWLLVLGFLYLAGFAV